MAVNAGTRPSLEDYTGGLSNWRPEEVTIFIRRAVEEIITSCLPILDGDFSLAPLIREQLENDVRARSR